MAAEPDQQRLDRVGTALAGESDILVAIAFGSAAGGAQRPDSDFDLGVLATRTLDAGRKSELIRLVADTTGRPVDLVDLRTAGVPVLRAALRGGCRLVCRDRRAHEQLIVRMLTDTEDFLPYRERILRQRRGAWIR